MARIIQVSALTLVTACWLGSAGCSSSNDPVTPGSGNTGNTSSAGTTSTAGTSSSTAGTGAGGASAGTGGSTPVAGTSSTTAGASAGGGSGADMFQPLCAGLTTAAGVPPTKAGACTDTDPQLCYKTCGPSSTGFKTETCTNGAYIEGSGCTFPVGPDYSCYKIPDTISAECPTDAAPMASDPAGCTVPACTLCNLNGSYFDSTGSPKMGYCVCPESSDPTKVRKWSCASTTAWPCPNGKGC